MGEDLEKIQIQAVKDPCKPQRQMAQYEEVGKVEHRAGPMGVLGSDSPRMKNQGKYSTNSEFHNASQHFSISIWGVNIRVSIGCQSGVLPITYLTLYPLDGADLALFPITYLYS